MSRGRSCIDCGRITTTGNRCPTHQAEHQTRKANRLPWTRRRWTSAWQKTREQIKQRDGHTCRIQHCNHHDPSGRTLQVHHINPLADGGTDDHWNLITVCQQHHRQLERDEQRARTKKTSDELAENRGAGQNR